MFVNINDHPTNRNLQVFFFKENTLANYFECMLIEEKVWYEKQIDEEGDKTIYFGIKRHDFTKVKKLNYLTHGRFRKKFIPDTFFRTLVISISLLVVGLAIAGAILT